MLKRKILLLALLLMLFFTGLAVANSPSAYVSQRFVTLSGGAIQSDTFAVTSVIGQPASEVGVSTAYRVSSGFLYPLQSRKNSNTVWLPLIVKK